VRERRLGQIELRGRTLERATLGNGEKGLKAEKIDPRIHGKPSRKPRTPGPASHASISSIAHQVKTCS
jgi:hypothetical protein